MFWRDQQRIVRWLALVTLLLFVELVLGGMARSLGFPHTNPGIVGWLPPLSETDWQLLLRHYQSLPRFHNLNASPDLAAFQPHFWVEYFHRLTSRLAAILFLLPWGWHVFRGHLHTALALRLGLLALLTALLELAVALPHTLAWAVPYDPALIMALTLGVFATTFRTLLEVNHLEGWRPPDRNALSARANSRLFLLVLFLTLLSGNLTAITGGGLAFNTFPLMNGRWIPGDLLLLSPAPRNFVENVAAVQWEHRLLALLSGLFFLGLILTLLRHGRLLEHLRETALTALLLLAQITLGIATLLMIAPPPLAIAHQLLGMLLFSMALWLHQNLR